MNEKLNDMRATEVWTRSTVGIKIRKTGEPQGRKQKILILLNTDITLP